MIQRRSNDYRTWVRAFSRVFEFRSNEYWRIWFENLQYEKVAAQLIGVGSARGPGSLDGIFAVSHGLSPHAELYSVPTGNVATGAARVHIGDFDPVNGGYLGILFNWRAVVCPTGFTHALSKYHEACR